MAGRMFFFVFTVGQLSCLYEAGMNKELGVPFWPIVFYLLCESNSN